MFTYLRVSIAFSLLLLFTACEENPATDRSILFAISEEAKERQDLFFDMINDLDPLGDGGLSADVFSIIDIRDADDGTVAQWTVKGVTNEEQRGIINMSPTEESGDQLILQNGRVFMINADPVEDQISQTEYRVNRDLSSDLALRAFNNSFASEVVHIINIREINTVERSMILRGRNIDGQEVLVTLAW